jgi:hypothetical protein
MSDLTKHLDDLDPTPTVRALATTLDGRTAIESDRQAQYVSLRPSLHGAVALYLHRRYASIALPPERALAVAPQLPGAVLRKKTPATTYLVLENGILDQHAQLATDLAVEAVSWRANGPKSAVGAGSSKTSAKELEFCLIHNILLLPSGVCADCE